MPNHKYGSQFAVLTLNGSSWKDSHVLTFYGISHQMMCLFTGSREAAFVYSISSAGMVHTLTRACSQGELDSCSCDPRKKGTSHDSEGLFNWGGCSDHVDHAIKFTQAFVDAKESKEKDARALMNLHNNRLGRRVSAVVYYLLIEISKHFFIHKLCTVLSKWPRPLWSHS